MISYQAVLQRLVFQVSLSNQELLVGQEILLGPIKCFQSYVILS
jgi:hypothetical protein